ncbi:MAG: hypothetical protein AB8G05_06080 [Oligoflexales bacterium]
MNQVSENMEAIGPNLKSSLNYNANYTVNYYKGMLAPPNTMLGGAKLGAFLGIAYYMYLEGGLSFPIKIAGSLVDLPNKFSQLIFKNKISKRKDTKQEAKRIKEILINN